MNNHTKPIAGPEAKPIAGPAGMVVDTLKGFCTPSTTKRIYEALGMILATYPADANIVVTFVYPGTKREHITVQPCHIIASPDSGK